MTTMMDWINASKEIVTNSESCVCPNCGNTGLNIQFFGDKDKMMGHSYIWCDNCLHGIHVSRTKIPEDIHFLPMNVSKEELAKYVPEYKMIF